MSIVATEIESIHGAAPGQRMVYYRCQDDQGLWHTYGPVITVGSEFDPDVYKTVVASRVATQLAEAEARALLGD